MLQKGLQQATGVRIIMPGRGTFTSYGGAVNNLKRYEALTCGYAGNSHGFNGGSFTHNGNCHAACGSLSQVVFHAVCNNHGLHWENGNCGTNHNYYSGTTLEMEVPIPDVDCDTQHTCSTINRPIKIPGQTCKPGSGENCDNVCCDVRRCKDSSFTDDAHCPNGILKPGSELTQCSASNQECAFDDCCVLTSTTSTSTTSTSVTSTTTTSSTSSQTTTSTTQALPPNGTTDGVYIIGGTLPSNNSSYSYNDGCQDGYAEVKSAEDCASAMESLYSGYSSVLFGGVKPFFDAPAGCFLLQNKNTVYWNPLGAAYIPTLNTNNGPYIPLCKDLVYLTGPTGVPNTDVACSAPETGTQAWAESKCDEEPNCLFILDAGCANGSNNINSNWQWCSASSIPEPTGNLAIDTACTMVHPTKYLEATCVYELPTFPPKTTAPPITTTTTSTGTTSTSSTTVSTTTSIEDHQCLWTQHSGQDNVMECMDGYRCSGFVDGWSCCSNHGGRAKCPQNWPLMCAQPNCAAAGTDYCCLTDCTYFGGNRECSALSVLNSESRQSVSENIERENFSILPLTEQEAHPTALQQSNNNKRSGPIFEISSAASSYYNNQWFHIHSGVSLLFFMLVLLEEL